jgi:two-component system, NtrC family, sensor kinase
MKVKLFIPLFIVVIIICFPPLLFAQQKPIDSLQSVLAKYTTVANFERDTNYLNTLNELALKYNNINPDTTILLGQHIIDLCNKINYRKGKVDALKNTGLAYNVKGEYNRALAFFAEALELAVKLGYIKGAGRLYHNIGIVYSNVGKYPEALENYFKALKIREELGEKLGIASSVNGIGAIYFVQRKYTDALNNYLKALKLSEEINYIAGIESAYANIGEVYFRQGKYDEAQENLLKSLKITEQTGNKETMSFLSTLIGSIYSKQGRYNDAIAAYLKSKQRASEIGSQEYASRSFLGLGDVYLALKKYNEALQYTQEGIKIAKQIGYNELLRDGNEILSKIYEAKGSGMMALFHQRQFKLYADSINNQQTEQRAANLAADYEYSKKEILLKAEQEKKEVEFQKQNNQQRWIIFSAFAALFSALVVAWLIFRSRQKEKTANRLLHRQNEEIDKQKNNLEKALSDLKATQAQLIQSEKMASLGELTAGIAHEIQNPLNFVNNFSEVSAELVDEMGIELKSGNRDDAMAIANDIKQNLEKITHHGKRADAIVKGMLQHSRSSSGIKEPTDINALCDEYLLLAYHGLKAKDKSFNVILKTDFDESIGNINIIPQDIGRVILNLINNAFYAASPPSKGGISEPVSNKIPTVWVSTKKEGNKVLIGVKDNGPGIPANILDKIFQPFFTTKPTGQGTGLGLSLSYDIVKAHRGELKVETKEGEGSEFIIQLPL